MHVFLSRAHCTCRKAGSLNVTFTFAGRASPQSERRRMAQHILIVDDDPVQRRLLEAAITRAGMAVVTAPGGQPALEGVVIDNQNVLGHRLPIPLRRWSP